MQNTSESKAWSSKLPQGLDLEVSHHPITMRHIANLIIAMERLKGGEGVTMGTEFKDKDLLNFLLESAVEGREQGQRQWTGLEEHPKGLA